MYEQNGIEKFNDKTYALQLNFDDQTMRVAPLLLAHILM